MNRNKAVNSNEGARQLAYLTVFAIAMAYLESAVVVYLRQLFHPQNLRQVFPPGEFSPAFLVLEIGREAATIIMMWAVARLVARSRPDRLFPLFVFLFGVWDLFYYFWLKILIGWPVHWLEWDILFLIPFAWVGPWLTAALIALLLVVWSFILLRNNIPFRNQRRFRLLFLPGCALCIAAFLQPALAAYLQSGKAALAALQPSHFWWPLFAAGYFLIAAGLWSTVETGDSVRKDSPGETSSE